MLKKTYTFSIIISTLVLAICGNAFAKKEEEDRKIAQDNTYELLNLFGEVMERAKISYVEEVEDKKLIEAAINGMLVSLEYASCDILLRDPWLWNNGFTINLGSKDGLQPGLAVIAPATIRSAVILRWVSAPPSMVVCESCAVPLASLIV